LLQSVFDVVSQSLRFGNRYVSFTPQRWENCIALQPADFMAFETRKFAEFKDARRKTVARIYGSLDFGGRIVYYDREELEQYRKQFEGIL